MAWFSISSRSNKRHSLALFAQLIVQFVHARAELRSRACNARLHNVRNDKDHPKNAYDILKLVIEKGHAKIFDHKCWEKSGENWAIRKQLVNS